MLQFLSTSDTIRHWTLRDVELDDDESFRRNAAQVIFRKELDVFKGFKR